VAVLAALLTFALESAVHSVHHLAEPQQAKDCRVLSTAQQSPVDCPALASIQPTPSDIGTHVGLRVPWNLPGRATPTARDRAPPESSASV